MKHNLIPIKNNFSDRATVVIQLSNEQLSQDFAVYDICRSPTFFVPPFSIPNLLSALPSPPLTHSPLNSVFLTDLRFLNLFFLLCVLSAHFSFFWGEGGGKGGSVSFLLSVLFTFNSRSRLKGCKNRASLLFQDWKFCLRGKLFRFHWLKIEFLRFDWKATVCFSQL